MPSSVLPLHLQQMFPPIIWIFIKGDGIESRVPFKVFSTLLTKIEMIRIANKVKKNIQNSTATANRIWPHLLRQALWLEFKI